ncbi:hypothetical protein BJX96DRAFT_176084 [Aspergillus floccosus]
MSLDIIDQPANPGDLILAYSREYVWMFLVKCAPSDQDNTDTSSILAEPVSHSIFEDPGFWTLSGPDVYYVEERVDKQNSDDKASGNDDSTDSDIKSLRAFLDELALEVLERYFFGSCPYCNNTTFFCPGCQGDYPDLWGSCGKYLSCPVCMGYDSAENDKMGLGWLEWEEDRLRSYQRKAQESELSKSDKKALREIKYEIIEFLEEKYETINERKKEMGLSLDDVDELVKDYIDSMCSD